MREGFDESAPTLIFTSVFVVLQRDKYQNVMLIKVKQLNSDHLTMQNALFNSLFLKRKRSSNINER